MSALILSVGDKAKLYCLVLFNPLSKVVIFKVIIEQIRQLN